MAKITILLALLAALLFAAAHASARQNHHHHQGGSSCHEIMERVDLRPCEDYIMQRIQQDEEEDIDNKKHGHIIRNRNEDYKRRCCGELSEFESLYGGRTRCMCRAQQKIMNSQIEKLESRSDVEKLKTELYRLPNDCGIVLYERIGCPLDYVN